MLTLQHSILRTFENFVFPRLKLHNRCCQSLHTYNILITLKFSLQVVTVQDFDTTSNNSWDSGNPGAGVSLVFVNMNVKVVVCDCGKTYQMSPELARKFYERGKKDPILPELTHQNDKILTCPKFTHYQQRY